MHRPGALLGPAASAITVAAALISAGCGDQPARIELLPVTVGSSTCGRPVDGLTLLVTALGEMPADVRAIELGAPVAIGDFPVETRQLQVSVLGGSGIGALGRTAPFELAALADGDRLPIFMAAPDGGCPVGDLGEARDRPLLVAAGDGALVVGGGGDAGPLGSVEWYDPATGRFEPIDTPPALQGPRGAAGMVATAMPGGKVVLTGGDRPIFLVFDPDTREFETGALFEVRAHHAAVALDERRVLIAGGCGLLDADGVCVAASGRSATFVIDTVDRDTVLYGPDLQVERIGGVAILEPAIGEDSARRVVLIGGHDLDGAPVLDGERFDPGASPGTSGELIAASGGAVALASGSVLAAFGGTDGTAMSIVVPGVLEARGQTSALGREPPVLTALEDGSVLIVGGVAGNAQVARYRPADGSVIALDAIPVGLSGTPTGRAGHAATRLLDGTVLVVGGRDTPADPPRADAWVFRPAGDSPFAAAVSVTPTADADAPLVPLDPDAVEGLPAYRLTSSGDQLGSWVVIGGMRPRELELAATVTVAGGLAVLLGFVDAEQLDAIELRDGEVARLRRLDGRGVTTICSGAAAVELPAGPIGVGVTVGGGQLEVRLDDEVALACALADPRAGLVGIAALGDGATVTLSTVSVAR